MDTYDEYIGFYEWEGMPCQILCDENDPDILKAQAYHRGKGMTPVSLIDVLNEGEPLSEARFKAMVLERIGGKRG